MASGIYVATEKRFCGLLACEQNYNRLKGEPELLNQIGGKMKIENIKISKKYSDARMNLREKDFSLKNAGKADMKLNAGRLKEWLKK